MQEYFREKLLEILSGYGIHEIKEFVMEDSSHGEEDIRHNYMIDHRYVLRVNSAAVMTEERIEELNALIRTYNDFGIAAPFYIRAENGRFTQSYEGNTVYLSEYLDMQIADDLAEKNPKLKEKLKIQRLIMISRFAEKYKNKMTSAIYSMYSLFDLAPYDIPYGIDEKEQNLNDLCSDLEKMGEKDLIEKLTREDKRIRAKLLTFYKNLPHCVFQGDENFTNVCLNEQNEIAGLFDFNMSGMDINANYLANSAFMGRFILEDDIFETHDAEWVFGAIIESLNKSTELIRQYYNFTEPELEAYYLYAKIYMYSGYANASAFQFFLEKPEYKDSCLQLIRLIIDWNKPEERGTAFYV